MAWPSQRCTDPIGPHRCVQLCQLSHWPVQCTQPSATTVRGQWLQWLEDEACHVTLASILPSDTPKDHQASLQIFRFDVHWWPEQHTRHLLCWLWLHWNISCRRFRLPQCLCPSPSSTSHSWLLCRYNLVVRSKLTSQV